MSKASALSDFVPGLIAGTINAIVCIVSAMALAALIFTGPLAEYLPQGIGILLMGTAIFAVLSALTATYPLIFSAPQDIPIAILALMATTVAAGVRSYWSHLFNSGSIFLYPGPIQAGGTCPLYTFSCCRRLFGRHRVANCQILFYYDDGPGFKSSKPVDLV